MAELGFVEILLPTGGWTKRDGRRPLWTKVEAGRNSDKRRRCGILTFMIEI
jgi:hypothetical protein